MVLLRDEARLRPRLGRFPSYVYRHTWAKVDFPQQARDAIAGMSRAVSEGNRKVFAELAPLFVRFVEVLSSPAAERGPGLEAFLDGLRPGASDREGQEALRRAFSNYAAAVGEKDAAATPPWGPSSPRGWAGCSWSGWRSSSSGPSASAASACAAPSRRSGSASRRATRCGCCFPAGACCRSAATRSRGRPRSRSPCAPSLCQSWSRSCAARAQIARGVVPSDGIWPGRGAELEDRGKRRPRKRPGSRGWRKGPGECRGRCGTRRGPGSTSRR